MNNEITQLKDRIVMLESQVNVAIVSSKNNESDRRINLADVFSLSPSQTPNDPFWNFMMWGKVTLAGGGHTFNLQDSRILATSTPVISHTSATATSVTVTTGSCVFTSSANFDVYYLIIF